MSYVHDKIWFKSKSLGRDSCIDFNTHQLVFPRSFILNFDSFWQCIDYIQVLFSYAVLFSKWANYFPFFLKFKWSKSFDLKCSFLILSQFHSCLFQGLWQETLLLILLLSTMTDFTVKFTLNFPSKKHIFSLQKNFSLHSPPPTKKGKFPYFLGLCSDYLINCAFNIRFTIIICITLTVALISILTDSSFLILLFWILIHSGNVLIIFKYFFPI